LVYAATLEKCDEWNECSRHSRPHTEPFAASSINKTSKRNWHLPKQKAAQQNLKDIQETETPPFNAN
jgi:hypothetical protein